MLKNKSILFYFLIFSILIHIILEILFPSMYGDQYLQINSFYNFIKGNGVTLNIVDVNDVSQIKYEPLNLWPFGFIILNYPFFMLFGDINVSTLILNMLFIFIFFNSIYKTLNLKDLNFSVRSKVVILLFFSIAIMPSRYMGATDLWSLALLFLLLYLTLKLIFYSMLTSKAKFFYSAIICVSILLLISLRYTNWLVAFSFPVALLAYSFWGNRNLIKVAAFTAIFSLILAGSYILFHYQYFGKINPTSLKVSSNLNFNALLVYNPLYINTLFRDSILRSFFVNSFTFSNNVFIFQIITQLFNLILGALVFFILYKYAFKPMKSIKALFESKLVVFICCTLLILVVNNITIILAALKYGYLYTSNLYPLGYTVVAEVRYFAPTLIILFIYLIMAYNLSQKSSIKFLLKSIILAGFCFAIGINLLLVLARFNYSVMNIPKYLHTEGYNHTMYNYLKNKTKNGTESYVYLQSPYGDMLDSYMAAYAHIPNVKDANWSNLVINSSREVNVFTLINVNDTTLNKFDYKIVINSLKPMVHLVEFKIKPKI